MSTFNIGAVNADNALFGDGTVQINIQDLMQRLDADVARHRSRFPEPATADRALADLRRECAAQPVDVDRVRAAAGALTAATAGAPGVHDGIEELLDRVTRMGTGRHP
ncbi:MAG TPA: hypothetical protein VFC01_12615 [Mycobacterium sp.]|nr:hypothetical protein [Mycobacterium sp.]